MILIGKVVACTRKDRQWLAIVECPKFKVIMASPLPIDKAFRVGDELLIRIERRTGTKAKPKRKALARRA